MKGLMMLKNPQSVHILSAESAAQFLTMKLLKVTFPAVEWQSLTFALVLV